MLVESLQWHLLALSLEEAPRVEVVWGLTELRCSALATHLEHQLSTTLLPSATLLCTDHNRERTGPQASPYSLVINCFLQQRPLGPKLFYSMVPVQSNALKCSCSSCRIRDHVWCLLQLSNLCKLGLPSLHLGMFRHALWLLCGTPWIM